MDDYISREAARPDAFCDGVSCQECPFLKNSVTGGCRVDDFIKAIPAADVRPVWIPVTERLPPEAEETNEPARWSEKVVFWHMGGERIGWYSYAFNVWSVSGNVMTIRADYVTHWMPLPDPPEGGADG